MLTGATDIDFEYEAQRIRATIGVNSQLRTAPLPHQHMAADVPDLPNAHWFTTYGG
jgi:hypothetical protein